MILCRSVVLGVVVVGSAGIAAEEAPPSPPEPLIEQLRKQEARIAELEGKLGKAAPDTGGGGGFVKWNEISLAGSRFKLYGFLRLDGIYDDSRPNNTQVISFVRSEDEDAPASFGAKKDRSDLTIHPRLTRLGLDFDGPVVAALGDVKTTGKMEIDFYNVGLLGQSESRAAIRMRHAYLRLAWNDFSILAGQTADVISPIFPIVNPDLVMWGAGNLGDRRPQLRGEYTPALGTGKVILQGEVGLTGADDNQDLDAPGTFGAGYRDGETSGLPTLQARGAYRLPVFEKADMEVGVWGHKAWEDPDTRIGTGGDTYFDSHAYGMDVTLPLYRNVVWLKGEIWGGTNVDDVRGGIFQGINTTTGDTIDSRGGWAELGFRPLAWYSFHAGYSTDDPKSGDLVAGGRAANRIAYVAQRFTFDPIEFGIDYLYWTTEYVGFHSGIDNRVQAYISYRF